MWAKTIENPGSYLREYSYIPHNIMLPNRRSPYFSLTFDMGPTHSNNRFFGFAQLI